MTVKNPGKQQLFFFDEILHCNKMMLSENKGENDQTLIC